MSTTTKYPTPCSPIIELQGLSKSFQEGGQNRAIFHNLNTTIQSGEHVALLGRSGSGKTTLLNMIGGIDQPNEGEVRVAGCSITRLDEQQRTLFRRRHIGFVFQFFNLIPTLTVEENVLLPLELTGRLTCAQRRRALSLLEEMGLADRIPSFPDVLSGGEQQRVAIARALAHRPEVLLADEPTGNLDEASGRQVLDMLTRLTREGEMTLVMVTHSQELAGRADRVFTIHEGRLMESRGEASA
jgi:putative ABC transport system ATP-binding protein